MLERSTTVLSTLPANDVELPVRVDSVVERAIALMREHPEHAWTVESLAKATGCSRATFARRFAAVTGTTPLAFLTLVRLHGAARHLAHSDAGLAAIAAAAGYATEFAFGRAFKRVFRIAPGQFRRSLWQKQTAPSVRDSVGRPPSSRAGCLHLGLRPSVLASLVRDSVGRPPSSRSGCLHLGLRPSVLASSVRAAA